MKGIHEPEIFEFYHDKVLNEQVMRQPGVSAPPLVDIYLKSRDDENGFITIRKKNDVKKLLRRFKIYAKMVGKLKASMMHGTEKRTALEEIERLKLLAKATA
jgi:hypothetical protein